MEYSASFTAGGILYNEFEAILPFVDKTDIIALLNNEIKENRFLKIKTESARIRLTTEIKKRLQFMSGAFWEYYSQSDKTERKLLLFYICVKSYQLVADFHFKVTCPDYWAFNKHIEFDTYKMYLDELASKEPEVGGWSASTRKKCITNYIRMLNEAGFILGENILKIEIDKQFYCYFVKNQELWALDIFLLDNQEKAAITKLCI